MFIRIIDVGCGWGVIHGQKSHFTDKTKKSINEIQDHRLDWTNRSGHAHRSLFVQHRTMSVSTISNRRHGSNRFELCNQLRLHWNALERKDRPVSWRVVGNGRRVTIDWGILCTGDEVIISSFSLQASQFQLWLSHNWQCQVGMGATTTSQTLPVRVHRFSWRLFSTFPFIYLEGVANNATKRKAGMKTSPIHRERERKKNQLVHNIGLSDKKKRRETQDLISSFLSTTGKSTLPNRSLRVNIPSVSA